LAETEVNPLPVDPDFKISGRLWAFALYPELAPAVDRGNGILRYRHADPARADGAWSWNPGTRRLRRLNEGFLGTAVGAQAFDRITIRASIPRLKSTIIAFWARTTCLLWCTAKIPRRFNATDGGGSACPEAWESRHLYAVEATPRPSRLRQALQAKSVIYVNSETWFAPYVDTYSRDSQLFQNVLFWLAYRDRAVPEARVAIYPFRRQFVVGAARTDLQTGFATMCYLP
jgi:hypothetical protein